MMTGLRFPPAQVNRDPYPELSGEEADGVAEYLPIKRQIRNIYSPFYSVQFLTSLRFRK